MSDSINIYIVCSFKETSEKKAIHNKLPKDTNGKECMFRKHYTSHQSVNVTNIYNEGYNAMDVCQLFHGLICKKMYEKKTKTKQEYNFHKYTSTSDYFFITQQCSRTKKSSTREFLGRLSGLVQKLHYWC